MKKHIAVNVLIGLFFVFCFGNFAEAVEYGGVEFPDGAVSFADAVISYNPTNGVESPYNDPTEALGIPDYVSIGKYVSLGNEGTLILQFIDNSFTASGDNSNDLWIFEVGPKIEPTSVAISINGTEWIDVGETSGATSGIDIDPYVDFGEKYTFVKLTDLLPHQSSSPYEGADIDAVGAISSDVSVPLIANAGSDQIVYNEIILDGSDSYPSDEIISYEWQIQHREDTNNNITAKGISPTISNLKKGFYDATLTISNNEMETSSDTMLFAVSGISTGDITPCPPSGSTILNNDLSFSIPSAVYQSSLGNMELEVDFKFFGEQSGKLLWELESYKVK